MTTVMGSKVFPNEFGNSGYTCQRDLIIMQDSALFIQDELLVNNKYSAGGIKNKAVIETDTAKLNCDLPSVVLSLSLDTN